MDNHRSSTGRKIGNDVFVKPDFILSLGGPYAERPTHLAVRSRENWKEVFLALHVQDGRIVIDWPVDVDVKA